MVKWVPIVPPRSQLLKQDMTSLVFSSAANARSPLTQLDGLDQYEENSLTTVAPGEH